MTTNDTTNTGTGTGHAVARLAARAITAARRYRATDPPDTTIATPIPGGHTARLPPAR